MWRVIKDIKVQKQRLVLTIFQLFFLLVGFKTRLAANEIGFKGGLGLSHLVYSDALAGAQAKPGFQFGLFYNLKFYKTLSIQMELLYTRKGNQVPGSHNFHIDYIEMPILLKIHIPIKDKIAPDIFLGEYTAFCLSAKVIDNQTGDSYDEINGIKRIDFGIVTGASHDFRIKSLKMSVGARYSASLINIIKSPYKKIKESIKNKTIMFTFGFSF
jgi:hypothetical protein